jgi:hypothetical protein
MSYQKRPGKFERSGASGELFHAIMLEGFSDGQISFGEDGSGADLFRGPFDLDKFAESWPEEVARLNSVDRNEITSAAGVIVFTDSQGFVDVNLYDTEHDLERSWQSVFEQSPHEDEDRADDYFEDYAHGSKYEANISKRESRQQRTDWARAVEEGRVLKVSDTTFKSYPTAQACDAAFVKLRAQGIPAQRVPRVKSPYSPNARGIYQETGASQDDFVIHADHRGRYVVDLVQRGGTHLTIGPTRGYDSVPEAMDAARYEAQRRGIRAGVIFGVGADGQFRQLGHATRSHQVHPDPTDLEPNGAPPEKYRELHERVWAEARRQGYEPVETEWVIPAGQGAYQVVVRSPGGTGKKVVSVQVPRKDCGHCEGEGVVFGERAACPMCKGAGTEPTARGGSRLRPNHHHSLRGGLAEDVELLHQLIEMEAESGDLGTEDVEVTEEVLRVAKEYDAALASALDELVRTHPPKGGTTADDLWDNMGPYLVLMTLRGEGVGIWDGRWEDFYDHAQLRRGGAVNDFLKRKLKQFVNEGSGILDAALMNAAYAAAGDDEMESNARGGTADQHAADELELYLENDARFSMHSSHGHGNSALVNQLRKFRKGNYDHALAPKLWGYVVEAAAQAYCKENGCSMKWHEMFNKPTRELVAKALADHFLRAAQEGEFDHVDTKIKRS